MRFSLPLSILLSTQLPLASAAAVHSGLAERSTSCVSADVNHFQSVVKDEDAFCTFWEQQHRGNSPFKVLTAAQVTKVCKCIQGSKVKRNVEEVTKDQQLHVVNKRSSSTCTASGLAKLQADFSSVKPFCKFWNAAPRASSPFSDFSVGDLTAQCNCVLGTSTVTSSPTVVSSASATGSFCSAQSTATLLPVANATIHPHALANLLPAMTAVLDYAEAPPGQNAATVQYDMLYPQVTLENNFIIRNVTCSAGTLSFSLRQDRGSVAIINTWPQTNLVLITNSASCNTDTTRGVYLVDGWTMSVDTLSYTFDVQTASWQNVAAEMTINYGIINNGTITQTASTECVSSYSHSSTPITTSASFTSLGGNPTLTVSSSGFNATAAPFNVTANATSSSISSTTSSAPFVTPTSFDDLDAGAKELVLYMLYKTQYNADGSIKLFQVNNGSNATSLPVASYQPDNSTLQAELAKALDDAGLPSPSSIVDAAQNGLLGLCSTSSSTSNASRKMKRDATNLQNLQRRDDDTFEEYACNDYTEAVFGDYDDAVCGAYDLYQSRQAIACLFTGCYESTPAPPTYEYTFSQDWTATFGLPPNTDVVTFTDGSVLKCINCGLSLSSFKISGTITATLSPQQLKGAVLTFTETSETDMLMELNANSPIAYNWNSSLSTGPEQSLTVDGVFTLTPNVVFSMGVDFSADTAVSVQGGASMSVNNAQTTVDMSSLAISNTQNWFPNVDQTYPSFAVSARVQLVPYIRRLITVDVNILGTPSTSIGLATASSLGYDSEFLLADGEVCAANQLQLKSNMFNMNSLVFGDNLYSVALNNLTRANQDQCFNVPSNEPSVSDIAELRQEGQEFCTEYINYQEPTSGLYLVSTMTTISTATGTTTSTVEDIPTVTTTTLTTAGKVRTVYSTAYVTANSGDEELDATYLQKRGLQPTPPPSSSSRADLRKRQLATPALVSGWPASKISYACSQVATGTSTVTFYTKTSTAYNATVTSTSTVYTAFQGPAVTSTSTITSYAWSTTTVANAQKTLPATCPMQEQISCFNVVGHGPASVEGLYLSVEAGSLNPVFNNNPTAFYLTCDGQLTALPDLRVLGGPNGATKVSFNPWSLKNAALCTRDAASDELSCVLDGSNLMYAWTPTADEEYWVESDLKYVSPWQDASLQIPTWGFQQDSAQYSLVTLSAESITCPCNLDVTTESLASVDASTPSCPASDSTLYKSADGVDWQIQCATSYSDAVRSTTSAPTLAYCLGLCNADLQCAGATWDSSSNTCTLRSSMLSDSYPTAGVVHSMIRLQNPPVCPSSGSQIFSNGGFESGMEGWTATVGYQTPTQYGIRSPGDGSSSAYEVTFSNKVYELGLEYTGATGQGVYLVGGVQYTISGDVMSTSSAASSVECTFGNSGGYLWMITGGGPVNSWYSESLTFTAQADGWYVLDCGWIGQAGQSIWIDNISLMC